MYSLEPDKCAELITKSRSVVALTGAGISTTAGIPDFRGPQGLYATRKYDPERIFNIDWFNRDPRFFYDFSRDFTEIVKNIQPTATHRFLAQLESKGLLDSVITQNIDILHQAAGSRNIVELHGSYSSATCQSCRNHLTDLNYDWWCESIKSSPCTPIVLCRNCNGFLKPDIVFFGEPVTAFETAENIVSDCDLLLVLGSSLNVAPASLLPKYTKATTIIVSKGTVALSESPSRYFVDEELDNYFLQVARHMNLPG